MTSKLDILNHARENDGDEPYDKNKQQYGWKPIHKTDYGLFRENLHDNTITELIAYHPQTHQLLFTTRSVDSDSYAMVRMTVEMYEAITKHRLKGELKFRTDFLK